jgi:pimeloyl-ACP methyl ester carboxylesterase
VERAVTDDGAQLAWDSTGSGEPLLLIAGQAVTAASWDAIVPALARRHRVITFDHRAIGRSTAGTATAISTRDLARDAVAVLDAAGVERAHVYGHSLGGRVAQWLAIDFPQRVGALVLGATTGGDDRGVPRSPEVTADLVSGDPARLVPHFVTPAWAAAHPEAATALVTVTGSRAALVLHYRASRGHDAWDELGRITAPTLVLHGRDDRLTDPGNAELLARAVPGAQLVLLEGMRHGYFVQDATAAERLLDFLAAHPLVQGQYRQ